MSRTSGPATREMIIFEAFILFSTRQYDNVTFPDLEQATGLVRGSIRYHFKNKQDLFDAVVESRLLADKIAVLDIPVRDKDILRSFIGDYVSNCEARKQVMTDHGVGNASLAYSIVECSAFCFFDDFGERSREIRNREQGIWTQTIRRAMEKKEIADNMKPEVLASLFINLGMGYIGSSTKEGTGCDTEQMRGELLALYDLVKIE